MIKITNARKDIDFTIISELASIIWTEHYTPIIGRKQVTYMLDKFQSDRAIRNQVMEGVNYCLIYLNDQPAGYLSFYRKEDSLFLSKLYVLSELRGIGIGRSALDFLEERSQDLGCYNISLTVNKNNSNSIEAYQKMGFKIIDSIEIDIGAGFVMDDLLMKKQL